jgi:hypothetical protein
MDKWGTFFNRVVKATLWVIFGFVLLFILVALLIRDPCRSKQIG